jgi:hypothetical protein
VATHWKKLAVKIGALAKEFEDEVEAAGLGRRPEGCGVEIARAAAVR